MTDITHYTDSDGGNWLPWAAGPVDGRALKRRGKVTVEINGVMVHSLRTDADGEWDCVNGWRTEKGAARGLTSATASDMAKFTAEAQARIAESEKAQAYAMRVWAGQAPDMGRGVRIARVVLALEGQGLPTAGIKYPGGHDGDDDWTEEDEAPVVWRTQREAA